MTTKLFNMLVALVGITTSPAIATANTSPPPEKLICEEIDGIDTLILQEFPPYISKQLFISYETKIDSNFEYLNLGQTNGYIKVDNTNITLYGLNSYSTLGVRETIAHGLSIGKELKVTIHIIGEETSPSTMNADVTVTTSNTTFRKRLNTWYYTHGGKITADFNYIGKDATLLATCFDFNCPVWAMGDSYFGMSNVRWPYYMRKMGYFNYYFEGLGGGTSWDMYNELEKSLKYGTPQYLLWCLGMNNPDPDDETANSSWLFRYEKLKTLCQEKGITLILSTTPNVPSRINTAKNKVVKESGLRYIDFAQAVGAEETGSAWLDGMLSKDGLHPAAPGAQALAQQVLIDFPEMLTLAKTISAGDIDGNGTIDIADVNTIINIILSNDDSNMYQGREDVNGDGMVDIFDINMIIDKLI